MEYIKMALDTTQQIGFALEATPETDPINATNALYWKFGVRTTNFKGDTHPLKTQHWSPVYKVDTKVPSDMELVKNTISGKIGFYPTNGIPLYMVLGESSSVGDNTAHTITDLAGGGTQQTYTIRSESYTSAANFKGFSALGCKFNSVSGFIDFLSPFKYLSEVMTWNGIKGDITPVLNEIHTTGTKYPTNDYTMTGTERTGRYKYDTNTSLTWNNNDIISDITMFKYDFMMDHEIRHINNQADTEYIDEGDLALLFDIGILRGETNPDSVLTDYDAGTQRNLVFTIYNGSATNRAMTLTNATIMDMKGPLAVLGEKKIYTCHGMAEDISTVVTDNVADDFYGD
jgi:hypothetical protein